MGNQDIFENLFILDMANNHQGSVEHGINIIKEAAKVIKKHNLKVAIKLQYRHYDTFIHPDFKDTTDEKYAKSIKRFLSTSLSPEEFKKIVNEIKAQGLISICTPFDEESVDLIVKHGVDIIKIGSCSAQDWPLLKKITTVNKPLICSTGGLTIKELDKVVSFFTHRNTQFALLHCVAIYPTKPEDLNLNRIDVLHKRYPFLKIGFSSHEEPNNLDAIKMAISKGAKIFEKHLGLETEEIKLNAYSLNPSQLDAWLSAAEIALNSCKLKKEIPKKEEEALNLFKRGVFAKKDIKQGEIFNKDNVFFAIPLQDGQMPVDLFEEGMLGYDGTLKKGTVANRDYKAKEQIDYCGDKSLDSSVFEVMHQIKGLLNESGTPIGNNFEVELSHHYGINNFEKIGATIIDCINRDYCKKLIIQVPGQVHPNHFHKQKEESFQVLHGDLIINFCGKQKVLGPGDQVIIPRNAPHSFTTKNGVIFEEISTTHIKGDSYYLDEKVPKDLSLRKTKFNLW